MRYPYGDKTEITAEKLFNELEFFKEIDDNRNNLSYITYEFIPVLIFYLEKSIREKIPLDTEMFKSIQMINHPLVWNVWADAIENNKKFEPFLNFEPLLPHADKNKQRN